MDDAKNFPSTRWTCIQRICSSDTVVARRAMEEVCQTYWRPLHGFALSMNLSYQDAEDCVQGFLVRISDGTFFQNLDPCKGKLRSYLLVCFKRYIFDFWKKASSKKRGGDSENLPLNELLIEDTAFDVTAVFDQEWAKVIVDNAYVRLQKRYSDQGKESIFNELKIYIDGSPLESYSDTSSRLNLSSVALKSAVHRIRRRFGEELRGLVAETVQTEDDIDEEIRWLVNALNT